MSTQFLSVAQQLVSRIHSLADAEDSVEMGLDHDDILALSEYITDLQRRLDVGFVATATTLQRIRDHSGIGWYMGYGTQTYSNLVKAYAAYKCQPVESVEHMFLCRSARNPALPEWRSVLHQPDDNSTVLLCGHDGVITVGYVEGGIWYTQDAMPWPMAIAWAPLPEAISEEAFR